ncbi:MAG: dUTP diphosphatase [Candidatus Aminicenantaceae bacterium]
MELSVKKIHKDAKLPLYKHEGDAGLDIFSCVDCVLKAGETKPVPTGIKMAIPEGYAGLIWDKSGISLKGIHRLAGVIDSGYRGEVRIVLTNLNSRPFIIEKGMKIAQLLIQKVERVKVVESEELEDTPRGEGGFGSTGKY